VCLLLAWAPGAAARAEDSDKMTYEYLPSMLRLNRAWEEVSSDLSDFVTFTCRDSGGGGRSCSADTDAADVRAALDYGGSASSKHSIVSYYEVPYVA
jgi:hypothetical protein